MYSIVLALKAISLISFQNTTYDDVLSNSNSAAAAAGSAADLNPNLNLVYQNTAHDAMFQFHCSTMSMA
jgi:hypothetical protein